MRLKRVSFVLLSMLICWPLSTCHKLKISRPPVVNYESFHQLLKSGKPLIVEFGKKWYGPSMRTRDALTKIWLKYRDKVNVCFVEALKNEKLVNECQVDFVPTTLIFNRKGEEIFRYVGQWKEKDILKAIIKLGLINQGK